MSTSTPKEFREMSMDNDSKMSEYNLSQEAHQPLKIFPMEVWNLIAKKLDTNSLINLINSSQFFRQLLLDKCVEFLFQPVLKIMSPYLLQHFGISLDDYRFSAPGYPKVKPLKSFILTLRLGCRSWNKAIRELSSTINFDKKFSPTPQKSTILNQLFSKSYHLSSSTKSSSFLEKFTKSHALTNSNPFLSRSLIIMTPMLGWHDGDPQMFYNQIPQILKTFGHHVWSLYLQFCWEFESELERHAKTVQLLSYLPNLRNLDIIFDERVFADILAVEQGKILFSNLPSLRKLDCHNWRPSSFNQFVRWNPQITHLKIFRSSPEYQYNLSLLANMEFLSIDLFSPHDQHVIFENPEVAFPLLKKLRLHYGTLRNGSENMQMVPWSSVFRMLSRKLGESQHFKELRLLLPKAQNEQENLLILEDSLNERLFLKNLKRLTVTFYESKTCVDFLLGLSKSLEEVKLYLDLDEADRVDNEDMDNFLVEFDNKNGKQNNHIIKFVGHMSNLMGSNIWDVLPALQKVELGINSWVKLYNRR